MPLFICEIDGNINMGMIYLAIAIIAEVIGTIALKASTGFNNLTASVICIVSYAIAFYFLALVIKVVPVGIAYAIWSGAGIVLITSISAVWYKQIPDLAAIIGMVFILIGVLIINLFSKTTGH